MVAVLTALQQMGDHTALPHVVHLAKSARHPRLQQAALECLPFLEQRAMQKGQTLLHPTSGPDASSALVRPVLDSQDAAPGQFLRASRAEEEESDA